MKKVRKFQITGKPNKEYESLINDPLIEVIETDKFSNFTNYFIVVHYNDLNPRRDDEEFSEGSNTPGDAEGGD